MWYHTAWKIMLWTARHCFSLRNFSERYTWHLLLEWELLVPLCPAAINSGTYAALHGIHVKFLYFFTSAFILPVSGQGVEDCNVNDDAQVSSCSILSDVSWSCLACHLALFSNIHPAHYFHVLDIHSGLKLYFQPLSLLWTVHITVKSSCHQHGFLSKSSFCCSSATKACWFPVHRVS